MQYLGDFVSGDTLVISATTGISTATGDVTCVDVDASGNLGVGGYAVLQGGAVVIAPTTTLPGTEVIAPTTGTLVLPAITDVKLGVSYGGAGTEYTGTLVAGGGGVPLIGPGGLVG